MRKFWLAILTIIATLCVGVACSTRIITQDMIKERVVEYWYYNPATPTGELILDSKPLNEGDTFTEIDAPEIPGFTFDGWFASFPGPHDWVRFENGSVLPEDYGLKVHAQYTPNEYSINYVVNGITMQEDFARWGQYQVSLEHSIFFHVQEEEIAQRLTAAGNYTYTYKSDFLYFDGYYLDADYTQPLEDGMIFTEETDIHLKYDYCPVYTAQSADRPIIYRVDEEELNRLNGVLTLPSKKDGYAIKSIASSAFQYNQYIKELIIPEGYTNIEDYAFVGSSLERIVLPSTITYIGNGAFTDCQSLTVATINTAVDFDVNNVFANCPNLQYEEYGNGYWMGKNFMGLKPGTTSVEIKPICKEIPANAFAGSALESVVIPASVTSIGAGAFANCSALVSVTVQSNIDIDIAGVFTNCPNLKGEEYAGAYYIGKYFMGLKAGATSVVIKDGCQEIPADAFANTNLESISFPASVTKIGASAFENTQLTTLVIPATIEEIASGAFANCALLETLTINGNIEIVFDDVFANCNAIVTETYGNAKYVGNRFVAPVSKDITWAEMKPGCTYIPENAFKDCTKLNRVYVPTSVTHVGKHAFYNVNTHYFACHFEAQSISGIDFAYGADQSVLASTNENTNYYFNTMPRGIKLADNGIAYAYKDLIEYTGLDMYGIMIFGYFADAEEVTIEDKYDGESVGLIFQHIFLDNTSVKKLTIKACPIINTEAFLDTKGVEEIVLPASGCTQIGYKAFAGCESLEKVTIGTGVMFISKLAFENCNALTEVKCATALKAWTDDATLQQSFASNENMAEALKNDCVDCWLFDAVYTEDVIRATLQQMGVL